jgi:hypothetical protein
VNIMDVLLVIVGVLLFLRIVGLGALILADLDSRPARPARPAADPCLAAVQGLPPGTGSPKPDLPAEESILLDRLRTGEFDRERYRAAMTELAHRDSPAHPVQAPTT